MENNNEKILLPHHEQQSLCTTRLAYRQGRKLTAVKAYSITKESNHLLIFGVPSLNLRQETKALCLKFGKLLQFSISPQHPAEQFTETYHAQFDKIQSARLAKRMLDTKNFYGGSLHVCYAPELEGIEETRQKLLLRRRDVMFRLKNLQSEFSKDIVKTADTVEVTSSNVDTKKLNMGDVNTIFIGGKKKKKHSEKVSVKTSKSNSNVGDLRNCSDGTDYKVDDRLQNTDNINTRQGDRCHEGTIRVGDNGKYSGSEVIKNRNNDIEIVDCTSVENETITNINEHLNYDKFGDEVVRSVPVKTLNRIKFNFQKSYLWCYFFTSFNNSKLHRYHHQPIHVLTAGTPACPAMRVKDIIYHAS